MKKKLAHFVTHPIQYQTPLLKLIAAQEDIELHVFFLTGVSTSSYFDAGFDQAVEWDTPLTEGYAHTFIPSSFGDGDFSVTNPRVNLLSVYRALKSEPWDAVWVHGYANFGLLAAILSAVKLKIPILFRADSTLAGSGSGSKFLKTKFTRWLVRQTFGFLCVSTDNRDYYRHYGAVDSQLFSMPYAVDNHAFQAKRETELDQPNDRCVFLFASKFIARKNTDVLIRAFAAMPKELQQKSELQLAGSGPLQKELEELVDELNLGSKVTFLGFVNQSGMPALLSRCSVFVLSSQKEPFGLIVNEAMNMAKPVIVSDQVGCARDLVKSGENGWIVETNSVESLSQALAQAVESGDHLAEMGEASLRIINSWSYKENIVGLRKALAAISRE